MRLFRQAERPPHAPQRLPQIREHELSRKPANPRARAGAACAHLCPANVVARNDDFFATRTGSLGSGVRFFRCCPTNPSTSSSADRTLGQGRSANVHKVNHAPRSEPSSFPASPRPWASSYVARAERCSSAQREWLELQPSRRPSADLMKLCLAWGKQHARLTTTSPPTPASGASAAHRSISPHVYYPSHGRAVGAQGGAADSPGDDSSAPSSSRPRYGLIGPGTNCQEWAEHQIDRCLEHCPPIY
jgi:hypothetical protein